MPAAAAQAAGPTPKQAGLTDGEPPKPWVRLSPQHEVWINNQSKTVLVGGKVCLREGPLEMFACPRQTKEHESIVAVNSPAFLVHTGLLAVGAQPGKAAQFVPEYVPARGDEIRVEVLWTDDKGHKQRVVAQQWIRKAGTEQSLEHPWVFVGSSFWTDESTGKRYYQAEAGDMICVSNFSTAVMDLPVPSSQADDSLLFEAYTERIPPLRTKVRLLLSLEPKAAGAAGPLKPPTDDKPGREPAPAAPARPPAD